MKYSTDWLLDQMASGTKLKYLFFWGHQQRGDDVITPSCLSQWYERGFTVDGHHYPTAEHWMMAGKARLFKDEEVLQKILDTPKAPVAKKLGREVRNFDVSSWRKHMVSIVTEGSYHKFSQNEDLKAWLLTTGNKVLVEASPFDSIWGIGMNKAQAEAVSPDEWKGENWLGWCLMEARDRLTLE